jgi:K+ transporter
MSGIPVSVHRIHRPSRLHVCRHHRHSLHEPFFYTVPPGSFYFGMVISALAAIVASQAMITSSFQLLTQVMRVSYFPHIKTVHTNTKFHEQVYMPLANWLLTIGTVVVTAVYNNVSLRPFMPPFQLECSESADVPRQPP